MIDKNEISKASAAYAKATWNHDEHQYFCMDGFNAGANWAIKEFKKSLWHDVREEAKELLPIMQAFAEGKVIQYKDWDMMNNTFEWRDLKKGQEWDWHGSYRIKSEPTYRPFKDAEECWNEMQKHQPFGWVKDNVIVRHIMGLQNNGIWLPTRGDNFSYEEMLNGFTFADGEPFGVKEEEQ